MICKLFPDFMDKRSNLPAGMCRTCNNKYLQMEKEIPVQLQPIFWEELAEHVSIKKALFEDTEDDPCQCEICKVCTYIIHMCKFSILIL